MKPESPRPRPWLLGMKLANAAMSLAAAGFFGILIFSSLNCASPTETVLTPMQRDDSLAVLAILKANGKSWPLDRPTFVARDATGHVISMTLVNMGLDTIPPAIGDLTRLTWLELNSNRLRALPHEMENLTALRHLELGRNLLTALPDGLRLVHLEYLDLSRNRLAALPTNIDVTGLTYLGLDSNSLRSLPPDFKYLHALEVLSLAHNVLDSLPSAIDSLTALRRLILSDNGLRTLPPAIMNLKLDFLDVGENRLCFPGLGEPRGSMALWLDSLDRDWRLRQTCR